MSNDEKNKEVVEFYKEWTNYWDNVRGDQKAPLSSAEPDPHSAITDHRNPYVRLVQECLRFAAINVEEAEKGPKKVVDVGCGLGAAARYFAVKFGSQAVGINISPHQTEKAIIVTAQEGLSDKVTFECADAMKQPFGDGEFDLVWSMDSAEYMPDPKKFIDELARVTAPGGTIVIIVTCHRELGPGEKSLKFWERTLVNWVCNGCYFRPLCASSEYVNLMRNASLADVKETNINDLHSPLWSYSLKAIFSWKGISSLFCSGFRAAKGTFSVPLLFGGYKTGVLNVCLVTCRKPSQ